MKMSIFVGGQQQSSRFKTVLEEKSSEWPSDCTASEDTVSHRPVDGRLSPLSSSVTSTDELLATDAASGELRLDTTPCQTAASKWRGGS